MYLNLINSKLLSVYLTRINPLFLKTITPINNIIRMRKQFGITLLRVFFYIFDAIRSIMSITLIFSFISGSNSSYASFKCCGSIALRVGDEKSVLDILKYDVEEFKKIGAKTVFTACAGCYRTTTPFILRHCHLFSSGS